jgi:hypothetical protein
VALRQWIALAKSTKARRRARETWRAASTRHESAAVRLGQWVRSRMGEIASLAPAGAV